MFQGDFLEEKSLFFLVMNEKKIKMQQHIFWFRPGGTVLMGDY